MRTLLRRAGEILSESSHDCELLASWPIAPLSQPAASHALLYDRAAAL